MRTVLAVLTAVLLLGDNHLRADDDAAAIIRKATKAHGGEENLAKLMMSQVKSQGTMDLLPGVALPETEHTFKTELTTKPGKFKSFTRIFQTSLGITLSFASIRCVFNGEEGQLRINGKSQLLRDEALKEFKAIAHERQVCLLTPLLKDRTYRLSILDDKAKVSGKAAVAIKVRRRGDQEIVLYFDKDTNRLVKSKRSFYHIGNKKEGEQQTIYKNFKKVHGALVPHHVVVYHDGNQVMVEKIISITVLKKVEGSEFEVEE